MKLRIKKRFQDKETKDVFTIGDKIERSEDRGQEMIKAGVAEEVKEAPKKEEAKDQKAEAGKSEPKKGNKKKAAKK